MKIRSRLKHAASGLLGFLVNRNNDLDGYWAPGLLYRELEAPPHRLALDLLAGVAQPDSAIGRQVLADYARILRTALSGVGVEWDSLDQASIAFVFKADMTLSWAACPVAGDPMLCTVTLRTISGQLVSVDAVARCQAYRPGLFIRSALPGMRSRVTA